MNPSFLFAALLWGSAGFGFFIYGKKQKRIYPLIGGIVLMVMPSVIRAPLHLSLASLAIIGGMYVMRGKG